MSGALQEEEAGRKGVLTKLANYLDWKVNPVFLRDLRLYTRGRPLVIGFFIFLTALVLLTILYILTYGGDGNGRGLLSALFTFLLIVTGAFVPNLVFERFRAEFSNRATELALMSPLTPARLVRGKLIGAWSVSLMVVATSAPMLAASYLLGGVNLLDLFLIVACIVLCLVVMPTPQLLIATQRRARSLSRIIASLLFVGQLLWMFSFSSALFHLLNDERWSREMNLLLVVGMAVGGPLIAQFLYFVTVSRIRPVNEWRDGTPRISLAFATIAGALSATALFIYIGYQDFSTGSLEWLAIAITIAAMLDSYAFSLGFLLISHTTPLRVLDKPRGFVQRTFFAPGVESLAAYFIVMTLFLIPACLCAAVCTIDERDAWRFVCFGLAPLLAIAIGINAYKYLVCPFIRKGRSPNLLPMTILLANLLLAFITVFGLVLTGLDDSDSSAHLLVAGFTPIGLLYGGTHAWRNLVTIGTAGLVSMVLNLLFLIPVALGPRPARVTVASQVEIQ